MNQKTSEIYALCGLLHVSPPHRLLEIGNESGDTLRLFSHFSAPDALLLGIDIQAVAPFAPFDPRQTVRFIQGDSHDSHTLERVRDALGDCSLDFLFIDGDHLGVEQDFAMYAPLVRIGGIIALHDIVSGSPHNVGVVPDYWRALKETRKTQELVENWKQGGWGIGVIRA